MEHVGGGVIAPLPTNRGEMGASHPRRTAIDQAVKLI
jgi:hypothetical protein